MAYNPLEFGKVEIKAQAAWDTPETSGLTALDCDRFIPPITQELFERAAIRGGYYDLAPNPGSRKGGEMTLRWPLHGWSTSGGSLSADPTAWPDYQLIASALGGGMIGGYQGTALASGGDANTIKIDTSMDETIYKAGCGLIVPLASGYGMSFLKSVTDGGGSDHTLELRVPMSAASSNSGKTHGTATGYSKLNPAGDPYTIRWMSYDGDTRMLISACVVKSVKLMLGPASQPMMEVVFVANSLEASTTSDLSDFTYSYPTMPQAIANNGARLVAENGTTTPTTVDVEDFELSISCDVRHALGHSGEEGTTGAIVTNRRVELSYKRLISAAPAITVDTSMTSLLLTLGTVPGKMWAVNIPSPINVATPQLVDAGGVLAQQWVVRPGQYTGDTVYDANTELAADAPCAIAAG